MGIQTDLSRIINAKAAIKAAIEGKGVTVPSGTLLDGMASLIESIEAGEVSILVISLMNQTKLGLKFLSKILEENFQNGLWL